MNFIVATLLLFQTDEEAFWTLSCICEDILPGYWYRDLMPVNVDQRVFMDLIQQRLTNVGVHLTKLGVSVEVLTTQWFLCIFLNSLSMGSALRVWDTIMYHGGQVVFQVALALLRLRESHILEQTDMDSFVESVGNIATAGDNATKLLEVAFSFEITGSTFITEVQNLRRKHKAVMLEEQRALKRRAVEYSEAQRLAQRSRNPVSEAASRVETSAAQTRSVLADFALLQHTLDEVSSKVRRDTGIVESSEGSQSGCELWMGPVKLSDAHVAIIGCRGLGAEVARQLARVGVAHLTLIDHRTVKKQDVERSFFHPEHQEMLFVNAIKEKISSLPDFKTLVSTLNIDIANPVAAEALTESLTAPGDDGSRPVDIAFVCVDGASSLVNMSRICVALKKPYIECSASNDGSRGHTHVRVPGGGPCGLCASTLPDFLDHGVDPFGDGMALMFNSSTRRMVAAMAVQQGTRSLMTGIWVASSTRVDAKRSDGMVTEHPSADSACTSEVCQKLQKFYKAFSHCGKRMQLVACDESKGWETVSKLKLAEGSEIQVALGMDANEVKELKVGLNKV